jgi:biotin synthase-like enzyme
MSKCKYCGNEATRKNYRDRNGLVEKERVCETCAFLSNEGVDNRQHAYEETKKELLVINTFDVDEALNAGMNDFWDTVNEIVGAKADEIEEAFPSHHPDEEFEVDGVALDEWRDAMYAKIAENLKSEN